MPLTLVKAICQTHPHHEKHSIPFSIDTCCVSTINKGLSFHFSLPVRATVIASELILAPLGPVNFFLKIPAVIVPCTAQQ